MSKAGLHDSKTMMVMEHKKDRELPVFTSKRWTYQADSSGSYSIGTLIWNTTALQSSNQYTIPSEFFIIIPWTITLSVALAGTPPFRTPLALKSWAGHLVDSIQIKLNGASLNQSGQSYANIYNYYRKMMNTNADALIKTSQMEHWWPDSYETAWVGGGSSTSLQSVNNFVTPGLPDAQTKLPSYNVGLAKRCTYSNNVRAYAQLSGNTGMSISYVTYNTANGQYIYNGQSAIYLKDLHPVFDALNFPIKNVYFNIVMTINVNSNFNCNPIVFTSDAMAATATAANNANLTLSSTAVLTIGSNGTQASTGTLNLWYPIVTMDADTEKRYVTEQNVREIIYDDPQSQQNLNQGIPSFNNTNTLTGDGTTTFASTANSYMITLSGGTTTCSPAWLGRNFSINGTALGVVSHIIDSTHFSLQAPAPSTVAANATVTLVGYTPTNYVPTGAIAANPPSSSTATINWNNPTGLTNVVRVIFMHYLSSNYALTYPPLRSPFSSEPAFFSSPGVMISNLNLKYNNQALFDIPINYDYLNWIENNRDQFYEGQESDSPLQSGLISQEMWQSGCYKALDFDLSRNATILQTSDVPCTITISGTNASGYPVDQFAYFVQRKALRINMQTSAATSVLPIAVNLEYSESTGKAIG